MSETRQKLEEAGKKVLSASRTELYLSMRFLAVPLSSLDYVMDLSTTSVGTDASYIRFNPAYLLRLYIEDPARINRTYLHMLLHCLFRHMFDAESHEDNELWDLCCDLAVESVIDTMRYRILNRVISDFRTDLYERLEGEMGVLTAQKLYQYFLERKRDYYYESTLAQEFALDDHSFWQRMEDLPPDEDKKGAPPSDPENPDEDQGRETELEGRHLKKTRPPKDDEWKKNADRVRAELDVIGKEASQEMGSLERVLDFSARKRTAYTEFLRKFSVVREEAAVDIDSFDYGFYNYGMTVYGNMPLIEENEFRESRKVEDLVIAIDTSASCQSVLVQKFLSETASVLKSQESFFHKVNVHIIECDDQIQKDVVITDLEDMKKYTDGFVVSGGFGTDFRPVFDYVERLQNRGDLKHLRGLMYFTDGFGTYPTKPTPYDTAFVFWTEEEHSDKEVPDWCLKLYLKGDH